VNEFRGNLDDGDVVSATAVCPVATPKLLGGGYRITRGSGVGAGELDKISDTGSFPSGPATWNAEFVVNSNLSNGNGVNDVVTFTAYAVCSA
jgi:hypothetical protein